MGWSIDSNLTTKTIGNVENVVTKVSWSYEVTQGACKGIYNGETELGYNPSSPFVAFADLSEATVIGFLHETLGPDLVSYVETKTAEVLSKNIEKHGEHDTFHIMFALKVPETVQAAW